MRTLVETGVPGGRAGRLSPGAGAPHHPGTGHGAGGPGRPYRPAAAGEKRLLQTAAVIGTEVSFPLLRAIAELPEEALHRGLAHLQAAEFLYETHLFPEPEYTFKHALTHEVAYESLLMTRRQALHAAAGRRWRRYMPSGWKTPMNAWPIITPAPTMWPKRWRT